MSISAANGIENCKLCVFIFIDTKKMFRFCRSERKLAVRGVILFQILTEQSVSARMEAAEIE